MIFCFQETGTKIAIRGRGAVKEGKVLYSPFEKNKPHCCKSIVLRHLILIIEFKNKFKNKLVLTGI